MYGTVAYGPMGQKVDGKNLRLFCSRVCVKVIPVFGCLVLLSLRFIGLAYYINYTTQTGCYVVRVVEDTPRWEDRHHHRLTPMSDIVNETATAFTEYLPLVTVPEPRTAYYFRCYDLSPLPWFHPLKELLVVWRIASIVNTFLVVLVVKKVPGYDGYLPILRKNAKDARFWSLLLQLMLSITYKGLIASNITDIRWYGNISTKRLEISLFFAISFIVEQTLTTFAVYVWNGVPAPWKNPRVPAKHWAYRLTLVVFLLEKLFLFLLSSFHATSGAANSRNFIGTALNVADAAFLYSLTKFFWNKLFYGERNLLINDNV